MTDEEKVAAIIKHDDETRMHFAGGYYSDWVIKDGMVIQATLEGSDWNEPLLIIKPIAEFVQEYEEALQEGFLQTET